LPITSHVTDLVVLLYTFLKCFFFNYSVVLPTMVNKDFQMWT